jgi:hypothetical protein
MYTSLSEKEKESLTSSLRLEKIRMKKSSGTGKSDYF